MYQKSLTTEKRYLMDSQKSSKKIQITILTSKKCHFCHEAITQAHEAADNLSSFKYEIEVVETSIDDNPSIVEELNVLGLPLTIVGESQLLGIPMASDIEQMVHSVFFAP